MDNKTEEGVTQETIENQQQETNSITDEMKRRDSLKVYVSNVGNYMSQKEVVKILSDHQIQGIKTVRKQRGRTFAFVTFDSIESRNQAIPIIETIQVDDRTLVCKDANMQKKRSMKRSNEKHGDEDGTVKKMKEEEEEESKPETIEDIVTPWWNVPYEEQKERKEAAMRQVLKRCNRRILKSEAKKKKKEQEKPKRAGSVKQPCNLFIQKGSCIYGDRCKFLHMTMDEYEKMLKEEKEKEEKVDEEKVDEADKEEKVDEDKIEEADKEETNKEEADKEETTDFVKEPEEGQICHMLPLLTHSVVEEYRNKCTFTIGLNASNEPCVGFRMGSFIEGNVCIGEPNNIVIVNPIMKQAASIVQQFIRLSSYKVYDMCHHIGFWRSLLVRYSERTNQLLLLVVVGNPYVESTPKAEDALQQMTEEVRQEIDKVMNDLMRVCSEHLPSLASFNYQIFTGLSNPGSDCPITTLYGKPYIEEQLFDLTFRVSPYAFFQVNTPVAEILYKNIGDWLSLHENTLLLDVCCGTGTIGLCLANRVKHVIGVDIEASAIEDAKLNAQLNHITNCEFICSPAEKVMQQLLHDEANKEYDHIVMICDPPRSGLHKEIVYSCRKCSAITELIYVSCNPTGSFIENTQQLCSPSARRLPGSPFTAIKSQPVDLFPYTDHCELMTLFAHM